MQQNLFLSSLSEIKVAYTTKVQSKDMHKIGSSKDAETVLRLLWSPDLELREEFNLLLLNRANKVTGWFPVSKGGVSGTVVDMKLIFSRALKCLASGIIVAHNHPSGNLKPSEADLSLTKKIKEGGKILEIQLLDHLILSNEGYFSFADEGLL